MADAYEITRLDHVQLAMPAGQEEAAIAFYAGLLGMEHVPKSGVLATRGGCWLRRGDVQVHLGVDAEVRPARQGHPALVVSGIDRMPAALQAAGHEVRWDEDLPDVRHFYVDDPFGNRIEIL